MDNETKNFFTVFFLVVVFLFGLAIGGDIRYAQLKPNSTELQQRFDSAIAELERIRIALAESEQSVERLKDVDKRRSDGIERIRGITESIGTGLNGAQSGEHRARIALEAIAGIVDILEAEFVRSSE